MKISAFNVTGDWSLDHDDYHSRQAWRPQVGHKLRFLTNVKDEYIREISWEVTESDAITQLSQPQLPSSKNATFYFQPDHAGTILVRCRVLTIWNSTVLATERRFIVVEARPEQLAVTDVRRPRIVDSTPAVDLEITAVTTTCPEGEKVVSSDELRGTHARQYGRQKVIKSTNDVRYPPLSSTVFITPDPAEIEIKSNPSSLSETFQLALTRTLTLDGVSNYMLPVGTKIFWKIDWVSRHGVTKVKILDSLFRRRRRTTTENSLKFHFPEPGIYHIKATIQMPKCAPVTVRSRLLIFSTQPDVMEQRK
jgi:hypothetical protein